MLAQSGEQLSTTIIIARLGTTCNFNLSSNLACLEHASWATKWLDYWGEIHQSIHHMPNLKFIKMTLNQGKGIMMPQLYMGHRLEEVDAH